MQDDILKCNISGNAETRGVSRMFLICSSFFFFKGLGGGGGEGNNIYIKQTRGGQKETIIVRGIFSEGIFPLFPYPGHAPVKCMYEIA